MDLHVRSIHVRMKVMTAETKNSGYSPRDLLRRKLLLGLAGSYREIGRRIGSSETAIRAVLKEEETGVPINRDRMLRDIAEALDSIEAEQAQHA